MSEFACTCAAPGKCPRYSQIMTARDLQICSGQAGAEKQSKYRVVWEKIRDGEIHVPTPVQAGSRNRFKTFTVAFWKHLRHGLPTASLPDQEARLAICMGCSDLDKEAMRCTACLCKVEGRIINKLKWAKEKCPKDKWGPVQGETVWGMAWRWVWRKDVAS